MMPRSVPWRKAGLVLTDVDAAGAEASRRILASTEDGDGAGAHDDAAVAVAAAAVAAVETVETAAALGTGLGDHNLPPGWPDPGPRPLRRGGGRGRSGAWWTMRGKRRRAEEESTPTVP